MMSLGTVEAETCAWPYLLKGYTSLRTSEAPQLKFRPHQDEPGARTPDGKSLRVHHVKLTDYLNVRVPKGLAMAPDAHEEWHRKRFPDGRRYFFPGREMLNPL
jgi:hypothetical protein